MNIKFSASALLEIDVQNDFCPSYVGRSGKPTPPGALAVAQGDEVIPPLNALAKIFAREGGKVIATADWHPADHISFADSHPGKKPGDTAPLDSGESQVLWVKHCVQGSPGADFHDALDLNPVNLILRKGFRSRLDSYSAFFENDGATPTGLDGFLRFLKIDTVVIGGLATDYCVFYSAINAQRLGYRTIVLEDAVRGVGFPEGSVERALESMKQAGIHLVASEDIG